MRKGKEVHAAIELAVKTDGAGINSAGAAHAFKWQASRGDGERLSEQCFGINLTDGSVARYAGREAVPADHMPVIVDLAICGDTLEVWDFKTGSQFSKFDYSPQVRANAYAVAQELGRDDVVSGLAYVTPTGIAPKSWRYDLFDLALQQERLLTYAANAPNAEPTPCSACKYCPARKICPAMVAA